MASIFHLALLCFTLFSLSVASDDQKLAAQVEQQPLVLQYHKGDLLKGNITLNLIWYGQFTPSQHSVIVDFIESLTYSQAPAPSTALWWKTTEYYNTGSSNLILGKQIVDKDYTLGKNLKEQHLRALATKVNPLSSLNVVLTAKDVAVDEFCRSRCGTHGSVSAGESEARTVYAWVGNSETQCPGYCAWPFHKPLYGPQTPPLIAPNGDVGIDGMIISLATVLAGTVTNPFNDGYFQGPPTAPLEAVSACTGSFGTGAYPGYPGQVLVDKATEASFNAHGVNGRKFLLPAMWDPQSSTCKTMV